MGVGESACGQVDSHGATVMPQQRKIVPRATAAIEDGGARAAADGVRDERRHESAEALEPEVMLFGERRRFEKFIHRDYKIDSAVTGR
jgi:hypothetical protein